MAVLRLLYDEIAGMFVDDGSLALMAVILVAAATAAVKLAGLPPLEAAGLIVAGTLVILGWSLYRATRRR